jgi:hypothetical protein
MRPSSLIPSLSVSRRVVPLWHDVGRIGYFQVRSSPAGA